MDAEPGSETRGDGHEGEGLGGASDTGAAARSLIDTGERATRFHTVKAELRANKRDELRRRQAPTEATRASGHGTRGARQSGETDERGAQSLHLRHGSSLTGCQGPLPSGRSRAQKGTEAMFHVKRTAALRRIRIRAPPFERDSGAAVKSARSQRLHQPASSAGRSLEYPR